LVGRIGWKNCEQKEDGKNIGSIALPLLTSHDRRRVEFSRQREITREIGRQREITRRFTREIGKLCS
jgi:hypothetical protein